MRVTGVESRQLLRGILKISRRVPFQVRIMAGPLNPVEERAPDHLAGQDLLNFVLRVVRNLNRGRRVILLARQRVGRGFTEATTVEDVVDLD